MLAPRKEWELALMRIIIFYRFLYLQANSKDSNMTDFARFFVESNGTIYADALFYISRFFLAVIS